MAFQEIPTDLRLDGPNQWPDEEMVPGPPASDVRRAPDVARRADPHPRRASCYGKQLWNYFLRSYPDAVAG